MYWYYAIALFGAAMTPYEVFFFSSGGVEENWTAEGHADHAGQRVHRLPAGRPALPGHRGRRDARVHAGRDPGRLARADRPCPSCRPLGKIGLAFLLVGFFAATFGAACETGLSIGYSVAQYFGWQWGKFVEPLRAARFHTVLLLATHRRGRPAADHGRPHHAHRVLVVFSAVALPLTYLPILVVANDRTYMGRHANGRLANTLGSVYLVVILVASLAAIPLMVLTKAGQ